MQCGVTGSLPAETGMRGNQLRFRSRTECGLSILPGDTMTSDIAHDQCRHPRTRWHPPFPRQRCIVRQHCHSSPCFNHRNNVHWQARIFSQISLNPSQTSKRLKCSFSFSPVVVALYFRHYTDLIPTKTRRGYHHREIGNVVRTAGSDFVVV